MKSFSMYVRVHALASAKKEKVTPGKSEHVFTIAVREPAEQNVANKRIRELVAAQYNVTVGKVKILTGHKATKKLLEIIS